MSEKRFVLDDSYLIDTKGRDILGYNINSDLVDLLNSLAEENEKLKGIERDAFRLAKENTLLFRKILKVKEIVTETDYFSDEVTKHDTIAYREMHNFDNKDAYDIASAFKKIREILE